MVVDRSRPVRVSVLYPRGARTGGPEALHQLVDALRDHGVEAGLVAHPATEGRPRVEAYEIYDAPERASLLGTRDEVVVGPEVYVRHLMRLRGAKVLCWWLSIDNCPFFRAERRIADWRRGVADSPARSDLKSAADLFRRGAGWRTRLRGLGHVAQSAYARDYLSRRLGIGADPLTDYIAGSTDAPPERRAWTEPPRIAYNPAKGARLVKRVQQALDRPVSWVPIAGMPHSDVLETLGTADVYLDLGAHPGKDRIPREAALMGAVTVVATRGSGAFHEDVPIPREHKVACTGDLVGNAVRVLGGVLADTQVAYEGQRRYREHISQQQQQTFRDEVALLAQRLALPDTDRNDH